MVFYNNNPTPARGVYRTTDGGRLWTHTLGLGPASGVVDSAWIPTQPSIVFASLTSGPGPAGPPIYRSGDGGVTWSRAGGRGLPPAAAGSASIAVAPNTQSRRLYALTGGRGGGGLYRSDDGGETWTVTTTRLASAGGHIYVDPKNPDLVYTMGTSVYRSTDGGRTLAAIKGAPGGDDPHALWIDPPEPRPDDHGCRPGAHHHARCGAHVDAVVHPVQRRALLRLDGPGVPVPGLRGTAGQRHGVDPEPQRLRRDSPHRLVSGQRLRTGTHLRRPAEPALRLLPWRRPHHRPLRPRDRTVGAGLHAVGGGPLRTATRVRAVAKGPAVDVRRRAIRAGVERPRHVDEDQPGSGDAHRRRIAARTSGERHDRRARAVAAGSGSPVGGHLEWPDPRDARPREDVDQRLTAAARHRFHADALVDGSLRARSGRRGRGRD